MASAAKRSFDKTLERVLGLLSLHEPLHGSRGRPRQHVSDILRSALVLAMAALDALVVDSVSEAVPALAKRSALGPTVAKWAKDEAERVVGFFAETDPHQALADLCREQLGRQPALVAFAGTTSKEDHVAESITLVCDVCGKPAKETVRLRAGGRSLVKDLCPTHIRELTAGARAPRRGRKPGTTKTRVAKRRGRPKGSSAKRTTTAAKASPGKTTERKSANGRRKRRGASKTRRASTS